MGCWTAAANKLDQQLAAGWAGKKGRETGHKAPIPHRIALPPINQTMILTKMTMMAFIDQDSRFLQEDDTSLSEAINQQLKGASKFRRPSHS